MLRQPFAPTYHGKPARVGAQIIDEWPELAAIVGRITINWAGVEVQMALSLGSLLGVENAAAVAVFVSLQSRSAQRAVLDAAAASTVSGEMAEIFTTVLRVYEELGKQRNEVVHCVWGRSDATPDGIIWSSQQTHATMLLTDYHLEKSGQLTHETRTANIERSLFVVRFRDLEALNDSIKALSHTIGIFHAYQRYRDSSAGTNALRDLRADTLLAAARTKRAASRQK